MVRVCAACIAEIDHDRLTAEREEEFWITEATAGGARILRQPDADPRAVLAWAMTCRHHDLTRLTDAVLRYRLAGPAPAPMRGLAPQLMPASLRQRLNCCAAAN
jgi:hypothetical protein